MYRVSGVKAFGKTTLQEGWASRTWFYLNALINKRPCGRNRRPYAVSASFRQMESCRGA